MIEQVLILNAYLEKVYIYLFFCTLSCSQIYLEPNEYEDGEENEDEESGFEVSETGTGTDIHNKTIKPTTMTLHP